MMGGMDTDAAVGRDAELAWTTALEMAQNTATAGGDVDPAAILAAGLAAFASDAIRSDLRWEDALHIARRELCLILLALPRAATPHS